MLNRGFTSGVNTDTSAENAAIVELLHVSPCPQSKLDHCTHQLDVRAG